MLIISNGSIHDTLKSILLASHKRHYITMQFAKMNWLGNKAISICSLFIAFYRTDSIFSEVFCFVFVLSFCQDFFARFWSMLGIHTMWQEFKIFTDSQNFMYINEALSLFEFVVLPVLIEIILYSYQLLPKIIILNILWCYL